MELTILKYYTIIFLLLDVGVIQQMINGLADRNLQWSDYDIICKKRVEVRDNVLVTGL